jgi:hypothetical protein
MAAHMLEHGSGPGAHTATLDALAPGDGGSGTGAHTTTLVLAPGDGGSGPGAGADTLTFDALTLDVLTLTLDMLTLDELIRPSRCRRVSRRWREAADAVARARVAQHPLLADLLVAMPATFSAGESDTEQEEEDEEKTTAIIFWFDCPEPAAVIRDADRMLRLGCAPPSHASGPFGGLCIPLRAIYNPHGPGVDLNLTDPGVFFVGAAQVDVRLFKPLEAPGHPRGWIPRDSRSGSFFVDHAESRSSLVVGGITRPGGSELHRPDESAIHALAHGTELSWEYTLNSWAEEPTRLWQWRHIQQLDGCGLGTATRSSLEGHYAHCCAAGLVNLGRALAAGRAFDELGLVNAGDRLVDHFCAALVGTPSTRLL